MIKGIAHLCFTARNLDHSIAFYCEKLGLKHGFDFVRENGRRYGVYLHVGQRTFIELFEGEFTTPPAGGPAPVAYRHFCLEVDNLESTVAELRIRGVEVSVPKLGLDGSWQAWLTDPDGNRIELHQYMPESRQAAALNRA